MNTRDYFRPQISLKCPHVAVRTYLQKSPPSQIEASVDADALQASGGPYKAIGTLALVEGWMSTGLMGVVTVGHCMTDHCEVFYSSNGKQKH